MEAYPANGDKAVHGGSGQEGGELGIDLPCDEQGGVPAVLPVLLLLLPLLEAAAGAG